MNRIVTTALALVLVLALVACRDRAGSTPSTSGPVPPIGPGPTPPTLPPALDATAPAPPVDAAPPTPPPVDATPLAVVDAPIKWPPERDAGMLEYRRIHNDPAATDTTIAPRMIVLHYTAGSSAAGTRRYFDNLHLESGRAQLRTGGDVNVSAHYLVDRDGTIYKLMPEDRMARHAIGVNHIAIGIENVGDDKKWPLTDAQVSANVALIRDLTARFPITHLLGHFEAMKFKKHAYYVELDPNYGNDKPDPGAAFMQKVRAKVGELKLQGL